jgi:hypothetical protein
MLVAQRIRNASGYGYVYDAVLQPRPPGKAKKESGLL